MKNQYWKSLALGTMLTWVALAEAGKCAKCDEEATPGAALCHKCFVNDLKVRLQDPEIRGLLRQAVGTELSLDEALALLRERANRALELKDFTSISEDISICLDMLIKRATELGNRIVAVPYREFQLDPSVCPSDGVCTFRFVKFALEPNNVESGQVFTLDSTWVYSLTNNMGVARHEISQVIKRITTLEDTQRVLGVFNDVLTRFSNHGFFVNEGGRLCDFGMPLD